MELQGILDIAEFQDITGIELTEEQITDYERANDRATRYLEELLGWKFQYKEQFEESAKSTTECNCPEYSLIEDFLNGNESKVLVEGEGAEGYYKLFRYDKDDVNLFIDPAVAIHDVKLAKILPGGEDGFVTVKTFDKSEYNIKPNQSLKSGRASIISWIELCAPRCECKCYDCEGCIMLVIDADWIKAIPSELKILLSELIILYMSNKPQITPAVDYIIKSESVDGHSVSYGERNTLKNQIDTLMEDNLALVKAYIGPYSPLYKKLRLV